MSTEIEVRSKLKKALDLIDSQLSQLKKVEDTQYKTHGEFKWAPTGSYVSHRIHKETNIMTLLSIYSSLMTKEKDYHEAAELCGLRDYPAYTWQGILISSWLHDLRLRIAIVNYTASKKDLNNKKKVLEKHLSEEDQVQRTLTELGFDDETLNIK